MAEYHLTTPISEEQVRKLKTGDILFISGTVLSSRDAGHRRALEYLNKGKPLPVNFSGMALYHVGPVVKKEGDKWKIVSAGPTTSARLEMYEAEFIEKTGVRVIIGKGGMGSKTAEACKKFGAVYTIFTGGAGALAAKGRMARPRSPRSLVGYAREGIRPPHGRNRLERRKLLRQHKEASGKKSKEGLLNNRVKNRIPKIKGGR